MRFITVTSLLPPDVDGDTLLGTALRLADLIRLGAQSPVVHALAAPLLHEADGGLERLYALTKARFHYVADPPEWEVVKHPDVLLHELAYHGKARGDCDDAVVLLGTLYRLAGRQVRLVIYYVDPQASDEEHISLDVLTSDGWRGADLTVPWAAFGWSLPAQDWRAMPTTIPV